MAAAMAVVVFTLTTTIHVLVVDAFSLQHNSRRHHQRHPCGRRQHHHQRSALNADESSGSESSQQASYGTDDGEPLPSTYATCGSCGSSFAITEDDLTAGGGRNGRRLECSVCGHSWFQSVNRVLELGDGFEMVPLPEHDLERIQLNLKEGRQPKFTGEMKLYVGNMSFSTTEEDLWQLFGSIGTVGDVSLVRDEQGRNRGFGFVTMREKADSVKALEQLDGMEFNGRNLNIRESTN